MKIGIKFCGGCNPRYDRNLFLAQFIEMHPDHEIEHAKENVCYDYLLIIAGCTSCCASYDYLTYKNIVKITSPAVMLNF